MPKELERDLGLFSVLAISIGAMVGSGIFILPALALEMAGPAVILAYVLAALIVLPAALSKAEMATAMPEAGGTYLYIERGMGPLLGTIAGIGTWFALSFKGALALVGGVPYLLWYFELPIKPVALVLAAVLILVNLLGAKQTGRLQVGIVAIMLAAMIWFVGGSAGSIQSASFDGFLAAGAGGILEATGFVFVSYAGVTKIASVAEEIEDPDRVIPRGMIWSLGFTTLLYVLVVLVIVGVDPSGIVGSSTPVADVAEATMSTPGVAAVVIAAMLALISTANAGLLSSSRYPFAMSRDDLAPPTFATVSDRFGTPVTAIALTGLVMLTLIAFVPIMSIAKLASAFQILVFVLINVALIAFRESDIAYDPSYESPLYPWMQGFGVLGGLVLLTQMGLIPFVGAIVIILGSVGWYFAYAHRNVSREGAVTDAIRRGIDQRAVEETRSVCHDADESDVLVALTEDTTAAAEERLLDVAVPLARAGNGTVTVVQFDQVPDQTPLSYAESTLTETDQVFEERTAVLVEDTDVPVEYGEIVSHDVDRAVANVADLHGYDLVIVDESGPTFTEGLADVLMGPSRSFDVLGVDAEGLDDIDRFALVDDGGPFDPQKVRIANSLAMDRDATVEFVHGIAPDATDQRRHSVETYHDELADLCSGPTESAVVESEDDAAALLRASRDADLVVVADTGGAILRDGPGLDLANGGNALVLHPGGEGQPGLLGRLLERFVY
ncbi:amino acid permease [Halorhabdus sp. BNX81]|uniref:amino acid permease n=1 Tax=Halorhabdus sp. BNX81 TaxID=2980181 RepID=UPI0023DD1829|nr:amino acid permease [Halorhabdus sp. BNX81]WEL21892.1 Nucleotide-binding protein, UspA family [Halorhabdus sp. BNX81]